MTISAQIVHYFNTNCSSYNLSVQLHIFLSNVTAPIVLIFKVLFHFKLSSIIATIEQLLFSTNCALIDSISILQNIFGTIPQLFIELISTNCAYIHPAIIIITTVPIMLILIPFPYYNKLSVQLHRILLNIPALIVLILILLFHFHHFFIIVAIEQLIFRTNYAHIDSILILQLHFNIKYTIDTITRLTTKLITLVSILLFHFKNSFIIVIIEQRQLCSYGFNLHLPIYHWYYLISCHQTSQHQLRFLQLYYVVSHNHNQIVTYTAVRLAKQDQSLAKRIACDIQQHKHNVNKKIKVKLKSLRI